MKNEKVHSSVKDNILGAVLADKQLISKFNKGIGFLLCGIDICNKYGWVLPLEDKKFITISNDFHKILTDANRKSNKIWEDEGSELYNRSVKSWLQDSNIDMN